MFNEYLSSAFENRISAKRLSSPLQGKTQKVVENCSQNKDCCSTTIRNIPKESVLQPKEQINKYFQRIECNMSSVLIISKILSFCQISSCLSLTTFTTFSCSIVYLFQIILYRNIYVVKLYLTNIQIDIPKNISLCFFSQLVN